MIAPTEERRPCEAWTEADVPYAPHTLNVGSGIVISVLSIDRGGEGPWIVCVDRGSLDMRVADDYPTSTAAQLAAEDAAAEIARDILRALGRV